MKDLQFGVPLHGLQETTESPTEHTQPASFILSDWETRLNKSGWITDNKTYLCTHILSYTSRVISNFRTHAWTECCQWEIIESWWQVAECSVFFFLGTWISVHLSGICISLSCNRYVVIYGLYPGLSPWKLKMNEERVWIFVNKRGYDALLGDQCYHRTGMHEPGQMPRRLAVQGSKQLLYVWKYIGFLLRRVQQHENTFFLC